MLTLAKAVTAFVIAAVSAALPVSHALPAAHQHRSHPVKHAAAVNSPAGPIEPDLTVDQLIALRPTPEPPPAPPADESQPSDVAQPAAPAPAPVAVFAPRPRAPQPPPVVVGSAQQSYINADRAAAGLPPLTWSNCLAGVAAQNAARMAAAMAISHAGGVNSDLACGLGGQSGENVGYWSGGVNDAQLNSMFMASPGHRANIMGPYHYVGTAWAIGSNGAGYIAVEFS